MKKDTTNQCTWLSHQLRLHLPPMPTASATHKDTLWPMWWAKIWIPWALCKMLHMRCKVAKQAAAMAFTSAQTFILFVQPSNGKHSPVWKLISNAQRFQVSMTWYRSIRKQQYSIDMAIASTLNSCGELSLHQFPRLQFGAWASDAHCLCSLFVPFLLTY